MRIHCNGHELYFDLLNQRQSNDNYLVLFLFLHTIEAY